MVSVFLATALLQKNLISNGSFDSGITGWSGAPEVYERASGRAGGAVHLSNSARGMKVLRYALGVPPKGKALRLTLWVKGSRVQGLAAACLQGFDSANTNIVDFATTQTNYLLQGTFDWRRIEATFNPGAKTATVYLLLLLDAPGDAWFDDVSVVEAGDSKPGQSLQGAPGLLEIRGQTTLQARKDMPACKALFPLPLDYREQVPLTYEFHAKPAERVASYRIREDRPGNFVLEASLAAMKQGQSVEIDWSSTVLAGDRNGSLPRRAAFPKTWPDSVRPWLRSTWCVQSADPKFQKIGKELRRGNADVITVVDRVLKEATEIMSRQEGRCTSLDAVQALEKQGSCTSNANLMAALLRCAGVPARILSGYPSWSGPLQTHYNVEAYVPGYGWYLIESTMVKPWTPYGQIQVSIVPPEYEDRAQGRFTAAAGVPYLSLTETDAPAAYGWTANIDGKPYCDHVCKSLSALEGKPSEWKAALAASRKKWQAWLTAIKSTTLKKPPKTSIGAGQVKGLSLAALSK